MTLRLSNAPNARDLGGHLTGDGRRVRRHLLFRADALHRLDEADLEVVDRLKLACVIDFRSPEEVARSGADKLPVPGPRLVELPIVDLDLFGVIMEALSRGGDGTELDFLHEQAPGGGAPAMMAELYRRFVSSETIRGTFAQALRLVATAENLPLLFHCTVGKDRTGWLAAVVLAALDVPRDVIMADYVRTNEYSREFVSVVVSLLDGRVSDPQVVVPMLQARPAYLEAAFAEADRLFGGMAGYLREGLGADDALLESLRVNLLES
jgi:protein-tyrosine phosphatase